MKSKMMHKWVYHTKKIVILCIFIGVAQINAQKLIPIDRAYVNELFTTKIEPKMFNWTLEHADQFDFRLSLKGYPDLPSWMRYMYSNEYHVGYMYGTPPERLSGQEVSFDVVALNKATYDTKRAVLSLFILRKRGSGSNSIHMKIDNLNWVHLMDPGRVENLKNIFKNDLWPESKNDLHISFMDSAVKMGGRVPLTPQQREGVIVHLASEAIFSERLNELQKEIKPLYKISSCTYKRTSVQTIFEKAGFKIDWCAFKIITKADHLPSKPHTSQHNSLANQKKHWESIARSEVPQRNYVDELAFAIAIPGMLFALLVALVTVILCFQHEKFNDEHSEEFIAEIFNFCVESSVSVYQNQGHHQQTVQMVQYSNSTNQPTTTLRSLMDPNSVIDNLSLPSQSPSNSMYRVDTSPLASGSTLRPRPPPYKPSNVHRNGVHI